MRKSILQTLNIHNPEDLKRHIIDNGPYSKEENAEIYENSFARSPRYTFRILDDKYNISKTLLADIGCSKGYNLIHCGEGSYGVEIGKTDAEFAQSIGLNVYPINILEDDICSLPKPETVFAASVLEHVDSPHVFLRRLHSLLQPNGLLILLVPIIPIFPKFKRLPIIGKYFSGYQAKDHIYAFTPPTLRFICERAGYETINITAILPQTMTFLNPILKNLMGHSIYVGKKIAHWDYPEKATRKASTNEKGYIFK